MVKQLRWSIEQEGKQVNGKQMQSDSRISDVSETQATQTRTYTVAIYEGSAPVNASLLMTCSHPRVVLDAAQSMIEQAALEASGRPGAAPVLDILDAIRSTQSNFLAQLRKSGVVA